MNVKTLTARRFSIRFTVGTMFLLATLVTAVFAIATQYYFARSMSQEQILRQLAMASADVSDFVKDIDVTASSNAKVLRHVSIASDGQFTQQEIRELLIQVLSDNPLFYSIYYARKDDSFYQIINLNSAPIVRERMQATDNERWAVIEVYEEGISRIKSTRFLTQDLVQTRQLYENSNYYPTQRPWYEGAGKQGVFKTNPYLFKHLKITGQTYSVKSDSVVIGIDIVLSSVNEKLTNETLGLADAQGIEAYVIGSSGELVATNQARNPTVSLPELPNLTLSEQERSFVIFSDSMLVSNQNDWSPIDYASSGRPDGYSVDLVNAIAQMTGLSFEYVNGFSWRDLKDQFAAQRLQMLQASGSRVGISSLPLFQLPISFLSHEERNITNLSDLDNIRVGIVEERGFDLHLLPYLSTSEFVTYTSSRDSLNALNRGEVEVLVDVTPVLQQILIRQSGDNLSLVELKELPMMPFHLQVHEEQRPVLNIINKAILAIPESYRKALEEKWFGESTAKSKHLNYSNVVARIDQPETHQQILEQNVDGSERYVYVAPLFKNNPSGEYLVVLIPKTVVTAEANQQLWTSISMTLTIMAVLLPVAWLFGTPIVTPITRLTEETQKIKSRKFDEVDFVDSNIKEVWQLSKSIKEMALEIKAHELHQQAFVESFIKLIAQAIDDKSKYTAGHCNRVPELGLLFAQIVEEQSEGKFKDFKFKNDAERREFRIAAWLHDCGKITTPEHIVDKGTKLEAIYNRIHEVRMRFEVLWRDAEIDYLKEIYHEKADVSVAKAQLKEKQQALQQDFAFIAKCNVGGEFLGDKDVEKIKHIASQTWLRHFDDRLGLGPIEEMHKPSVAAALPAREFLLSDRPEHIFKRTEPVTFDPKLGIKMDVPELLSNQGEIYNLSISRGTLTKEERYKINEHMISGIKMLEALPFPEELKRVPRYASTHHETLIGTGYPRKLKAEDLSIPERILVIADIFEALTAADRPYKKAKPLSVAVDIMYKMALDQHLDMDLFMLFLTSGTYIKYARMYLPSGQMDGVDIKKYVDVQQQHSSEQVA